MKKNIIASFVLLLTSLSFVSSLRIQQSHHNRFGIYHLKHNLRHLFSHDPTD